MRTPAGLKADLRRLQPGKKLKHLATAQLLTQNDLLGNFTPCS
jgi:hypothetical protein